MTDHNKKNFFIVIIPLSEILPLMIIVSKLAYEKRFFDYEIENLMKVNLSTSILCLLNTL